MNTPDTIPDRAEMPLPACTFADHSYPAYTAGQMRQQFNAGREFEGERLAARSLAGTPQAEPLKAAPDAVNEREAFEKWMTEDGKWPEAVMRNDDQYRLAQAASAWTSWQAAWAARGAISTQQAAKSAAASGLVERLKNEAQIHAGEARAANATVAEIYRIVSGGTGEPGNWHGAEPVRKCIEELRSQVAAHSAAPAAEPSHRAMADELRGARAGFMCPLCGRDHPHPHTPEEITIYRNGMKWGRNNGTQPWIRKSSEGAAEDAGHNAGGIGAARGDGEDEHHQHRARQPDTDRAHDQRDSGGAGLHGACYVPARVSRSEIVGWLDDYGIEVTDRQLDGLFFSMPATQAAAAVGLTDAEIWGEWLRACNSNVDTGQILRPDIVAFGRCLLGRAALSTPMPAGAAVGEPAYNRRDEWTHEYRRLNPESMWFGCDAQEAERFNFQPERYEARKRAATTPTTGGASTPTGGAE